MILLKRIWNFLLNQSELSRLIKRSKGLNQKEIDTLVERKFSKEKNEELKKMYIIAAQTGNTSTEEVFVWMHRTYKSLSEDITSTRLKFIWTNRYSIAMLSYEEYLIWEEHLVDLENKITAAVNDLINREILKVQIEFLQEKTLENKLKATTPTDEDEMIH